MEHLHDPDLASRHTQAQRERGAHHPATLPDALVGEHNALASRPQPTLRNGQRRRGQPTGDERQNGMAPSTSDHREAQALQLPLAEAIGGTLEQLEG